MNDDSNNNDSNNNDINKEKESEDMSLVLENNNYTEINNKKEKNNKGGMRKRILGYIIVGVICSTLGGVGSAIVTMNVMKNTSAVVTPKVAETKVSSTSSAKLIASKSTENLTVPEIVKKVSSSVVAISTKSTAVSSDISGKTAEQEGVGYWYNF